MADVLIKNAKFLVLDSKKIIKDAAVAIEGNKIIDIGKTDELNYRAEKILDASWKVVMPGMVNCHTHGAENLFKGLSDDRPLWEWYLNVVAPGQFFFTEKNIRLFYLLTYASMIRSGTTCFLDQYFFPDVMCRAAQESGLRANVAPFIFDLKPAEKWQNRFIDAANPEAQIRNAEEAIKKWHTAESGRIRIQFGVHTVLDNSVEHLQKTRDLANKYGVGIHVHLNESSGEIQMAKDIHGKRPLDHAHDIGLLGPDVSAAHCCWLTDKEKQILADTGTKVVHNPKTNMKIADGICPVPDLLDKGVTVALGSDGAGSSGEMDMFVAMKLAAILHKVNRLDASVMPASKVFDLATVEGAKAMRLDAEIGSIEKGKKADIILVDIKKPCFFPIARESIISNLVYTANGNDVDTVIVDGRILMENKRVKTIDEFSILDEAQKEAEEFISELWSDIPGIKRGVRGIDYWQTENKDAPEKS